MAVSISQLTEITSILDDDIFPVTAVRSTKSTGKVKYSTIKQNILNSVPTPVIDWNGIANKPFTSIGSGLTVSGGVLSASGLDFATLSGMIVQGTNMSIITDSNAKTITFNATGGIDFDALAVAMTTGSQSGITVTADTTNSRFNFEVTGIPTIAIDSEGYWTINGERGANPTKAQGEKGSNGISPTAVVTDTGVGATITITDKNGTTTADIFDGISPHIDETTKHWFIGEYDTGVLAEGITTVTTTSVEFTGVLSADGWIGDVAPYTQTVIINGITSDVAPIIDLVVSNDVTIGNKEISQWSYITKAVTSENAITFSCYSTKPSIAINFKAKVV